MLLPSGPAVICESPSYYPIHKCIFPTLELRIPQYRSEGMHRFSLILRLRMRDWDQYYSIAVTTIFFYDFLLTLGDEVSHITSVSVR